MNEFIGREITFGVGVEAVRGTAETTATKGVRKVECNVIPRAERVIDDSTTGSLEDAENVRTVRKWSEGDVSGIAHADVIGYYFANLYGGVTSIASGSAYEHTFVLDQTIIHDTLTLFIKDSGVRQEKIAGAVVSTLEINATTDDYVRYSASFMGKEGADDTSTIPALATDYDWVGRDIVVKVADTESGLSSAIALKLKNITLTWNSNAEPDYVFGSYSPDNIYNKQFAIEGSFERNFTDTVFEALYQSSGFKYMSVTITGETDMVTGKKPTLTVVFNKIQVTDWNRTSAGDALSTETVSFKAFKNTTDAEQSTVTLLNLTTEYITAS